MDVDKIPAWYECGMLTFSEAVGRLVDAATRMSPHEIVPLISSEFLDAIREDTKDAPRPKRVFYMGSFAEPCTEDPFETAARVYNEGAKIWKAYFEREQHETRSRI